MTLKRNFQRVGRFQFKKKTSQGRGIDIFWNNTLKFNNKVQIVILLGTRVIFKLFIFIYQYLFQNNDDYILNNGN